MLFKVLLAGMCSLCLVGTATLASAHEFIVKPDKTQAAKGESVGVQAQAAHVFMISEEAEPVETVVVELIQVNAKEPVKLAEDAKAKALVGKAALPADGPAMIVGHRLPQTWSDTTEGVLEGGRKDLEAKGKKVLKVGKYEKFAKTMLNPAANDGLYKKVLGHDLEIVLLTNPADIKAGDKVFGPVVCAKVLECAAQPDGSYHTCLDLGGSTRSMGETSSMSCRTAVRRAEESRSWWRRMVLEDRPFSRCT